MNSIIIFFSFIGFCVVQGANIIQLAVGQYDQCEGKDAANYTYTTVFALDPATCSISKNVKYDHIYLTVSQQNGDKIINNLIPLVETRFPAGAYNQYVGLFLVISGNLQGKFVLFKTIGFTNYYLKKCSSVLGSSYKSTKNRVLMIAEKLDPNVLISPTGPLEPFKKCATTICQGKTIDV